jgi:hypothetical protein
VLRRARQSPPVLGVIRRDDGRGNELQPAVVLVFCVLELFDLTKDGSAAKI